MQINRRGFLGGVGAMAAIAPKAFASVKPVSLGVETKREAP